MQEHIQQALLGSGITIIDIALRDEARSPSLFEAYVRSRVAREDQDCVLAELTAVIRGEKPQLYIEYRSGVAGGEVDWHLDRGRVIHGESGVPIRFLGTSQQITRLKRAEEEARRAEENARRTLEQQRTAMRSSGVHVWDVELARGDLVGDCAESVLTQFVPTESGSSSAIAIIPEDRARVLAEVQTHLEDDNGPFECEYRVRHEDGSVHWKTARGVAVRDAGGRPIRLTGTSVDLTRGVAARGANGRATRFTGASIDITDRQQAKRALQESEERFRHTFENAAVGMILQDITERKALEAAIAKVQTRMELALRGSDVAVYQADFPDGSLENTRWTFFNMWEPLGLDTVGMPTQFAELLPLAVHPDDQPSIVAQFQAALQSRSPDWYFEHRVLHGDGSVRWRLSRGTLVFDDAGTITSFIGTEADITQLKQIENELSHARRAAEAANRAKDEFLANVSHEIRTPMNAILGMTELALDSAPSDHQRQLLSTVRSAAKNLLTIINDLLDFSKIEAGKLALDSAPFSLRAAVGDTLRALALRAHRKGLELLCRVRSDVPDGLEGDAGRLRQVLMNLVGNAVKFTPRGEVEVDIEAEPSSDAQTVSLILRVRDTGIGIALEKQATIFRAFEQEDSSTTRNYGGTGLGLTISAQLAALMGGGISLESAPGRGSTFRFSARFTRSSRPDATTTSPESLIDLRVLIVDDNETNRRILEEWLASWRMLPLAVGSADAALAALARARDAGNPFALVLLDARMPDTDGTTLAGQIRARWGVAAPRLILLSSDDNAILSARSRENGVLAYLLKPVQQSELLEAIWSVMNLDLTRASEPTRARRPLERWPALRVLVAEDNELNIALLEELSSQRGYAAQFARDGRAALELALQGACDLLLLDLHMPELDGFEVVRAIREQERATNGHLPIIALTARSSALDRERCLAAGVDEFLSKPIEAAALWATVDRLLVRWPPAGYAARQSEPRLLDARAILSAFDGHESVLEKMRVVFRQSVPQHISLIRAALSDRDFVRLGAAAHQLVGTVGTFSTVTAEVASALEESAEREEPERCTALVDQVGIMCDALLVATASLSLGSLKS